MGIAAMERALRTLVEPLINLRPENGLIETADRIARSATPAQKRDMATRWLVGMATHLRRERELEVERRAFKVQNIQERRKSARFNNVIERQSLQRSGPPKGKARRRWLVETAEGRAHAEREEQYQAQMDKIQKEHQARMTRMVDQFKADLRAEWTEEILASGFSLPDGSRVTWGEATVEQHTARRDMFAGNAVANAEGAARHQLAIDELTGTGAVNLNRIIETKKQEQVSGWR